MCARMGISEGSCAPLKECVAEDGDWCMTLSESAVSNEACTFKASKLVKYLLMSDNVLGWAFKQLDRPLRYPRYQTPLPLIKYITPPFQKKKGKRKPEAFAAVSATMTIIIPIRVRRDAMKRQTPGLFGHRVSPTQLLLGR